MRNKLFIILLSLTVVALSGCPHLTTQMMQSSSAASDMQAPPNYNPKYLVANMTIDQIQRRDSLMRLDSIRTYDSLISKLPAGYAPGGLYPIYDMYLDSANYYRSMIQNNPQNRARLKIILDSVRKYAFLSGQSRRQIDSINYFIAADSISAEDSLAFADKFVKQENPIIMEITNIYSENYPDEIELHAIVHDTVGYYITGLAPPNFTGIGDYRDYWKILRDSSSCSDETIKDFDVVEVNDETSMPYAISFVLDHSGSMGAKRIRNLNKGVQVITSAIKKNDWVSVIKFAGNSVVEIPMTDERELYRSVMLEGTNGDIGFGTSMYEAVIVGVNELIKAPDTHKKAMILFTDGQDGSWSESVDSVLRFAKNNNVKIYPVAYGSASEKPLQDLADYTGGRFYRIYSINEFPYLFAELYLSFSNYYKITYKAPLCEDMHFVKINLDVPELGAFDLQAKGNYDRSMFKKYDIIGSKTFLNIEFESGKAIIRPEAEPLIKKVATEMKKNPFLKLKINGHTDDVGSEQDNLKLSIGRARAVVDKLVENGIERNRLQAEGFGETLPLVPNTSDENRKKNRRTEFVITDK